MTVEPFPPEVVHDNFVIPIVPLKLQLELNYYIDKRPQDSYACHDQSRSNKINKNIICKK